MFSLSHLCIQHISQLTVTIEFGNTADIEKALTVSEADGSSVQEWISLANGCICCSVKDSGVAALESLVERQRDFDYILLETTGVADPGNIAPMFWLDEGLGSSIYLDGIVTVVDAKNIEKSLDEPAPEELPAIASSPSSQEIPPHNHNTPLLTTAHLQISHADILLLNKTDLLDPSSLAQITSRLRSINSLAHLIPTNHAVIPPNSLSGTILDLKAYSTFPSTLPPPPSFTAKGHSHLDPTISTVTLDLPPFDPQKMFFLENWLQSVLWDEPESPTSSPTDSRTQKYEVHRTKGWIRVLDGTARVVQGVRDIFEIIELDAARLTDEDRMREGKVVFIGRGVENIVLEI